MRIVGLAVAMTALPVLAATYRVDSVRQRYPWNGLVDIDYTVTSAAGEQAPDPSQAWLALSVTDEATGETFAANAHGGPLPTAAGRHQIVWNAAADGRTDVSASLKATLKLVTMPEKYVVIDLSGGHYATRFNVSYLDAPPAGGFNTPEYKTKKLVLRYIPAGSFIMGSPADEPGHAQSPVREVQHPVAISRPFYFSLFELTRAQFETISGRTATNESGLGDLRPFDNFNSTTFRGEAEDVTSFKIPGSLSAKTGLSFDYPTDAQWEYVCRAGTTAARYTGVCTDADLNTIARWKNTTAGDNRHPGCHTDVGSYAPNPWGIYDLYGNVWEFTRDYFVDAAHELSPVDPCQAVRPVSGMQDRTVRGGSYGSEANSCRSAFRSYYDQRTSAGGYGYRLVIQL